MKNIIALCALVLCFASICVGTAQAKEIACGWGPWKSSNFNKLHGGQQPPEGACPPGPQTLKGSVRTAWVWTFSSSAQDATSGRRGANRVVKATGYSGVRGTFSELDINGILNDAGKQVFPAHDNKPTFYLGASHIPKTYGKIRGSVAPKAA